ncbi:MAG: ATP-binding protein, partial [Caldilineaceae bacterium]
MNFRRRYAPLAPAELDSILAEGPSARAAFLPAKSNVRTIAETIAAMANATGGIVLLGVTAKGTVQADNDVRALAGNVGDAVLLADPPLILPSAQSVDTEKGAVVAVQVPLGLP